MGNEADMVLGDLKVLIVGEDSRTIATLAQQVITTLDADVVLVDSLEEAQVLASSNSFDVILACDRLSDGEGLTLVNDEAHGGPPVILLDDEMDPDRVIAALRQGAKDFFVEPLDYTNLIPSIQRVVRQYRREGVNELRQQRLRRISSRLIRDRRELRRRVDLICQDLVLAYRRLAEKVVASGQSSEHQKSAS